jgi:hypothetical protein
MAPSTQDQLKPTRNPLTSFAFSPLGVSFEDQNENEKVILLLRRHWITNIGWIITAFFLFILPLLLPGLFSWYQVSIWTSLVAKWQQLIVMVWYLLLTGFIFERFLNWYFNVYLVTTERIIDVDFIGILYKDVSEAQLSKVQDITHRTGGFLSIMFDFGDLSVQTAAETGNLEFDTVPHPAEVHRIIGDLLSGSTFSLAEHGFESSGAPK